LERDARKQSHVSEKQKQNIFRNSTGRAEPLESAREIGFRAQADSADAKVFGRR